MGAPCTTGDPATTYARGRLAPAAAAGLVARAAHGDAAAWESLVHAYVGLVWVIARDHQLPPEDAADVVQVTWLRLVEHVDRLEDPERVGAWLASTARHESLRLLRRSRRELVVADLPELAASAAREVTGSQEPPSEELLDRIAEAFTTLPARPRALMRLLLMEPAPSYAEIASALDMPVGSIGPTRGRCLKALRAQLEQGAGARSAG
jgi:RNA polymerase sigma factor (sigma-70 family)